jgi:Tfp pilus assembly protein PilN
MGERAASLLGRATLDRAGAAWRWWIEELTASFPRVAAALSGAGASVIELEEVRAPGDGTAPDAGQAAPSGIVARRFAPPAPTGDAMLRLPDGLERLDPDQGRELARLCRGSRVDLVLGGRDVHRLSVRLPRAAASEEGLRYALQSDAPVGLEHVALAWCVEQPQPEGLAPEWVQLTVVMCRRSTLEARRAALRRCGLVANRIGAREAPDSPESGPALDGGRALVFARERAKGLGSPLWRIVLAAGAALGVLIVPLLAGAHAANEAAKVRAEIEAVRSQHGSVLPLAQRRAAVAALQASLHRVLPTSSVTTVLDELARRLGDDVWLQDARIEGLQLRLELRPGPRVEPESVVAALAASALLADVRLTALSAGGTAGELRTLELTASVRPVTR